MKEYFYLRKKTKEDILGQIASILKRKKEVVFAYCHGTFLAKNKIRFRDIDIAVCLEGEIKDVFEKELEMADFLEREIRYPIDLKILNGAPFYFLNSVFRNGKLLFSRNDQLLTKLIEESSREAMINYDFSLKSFQELIY